MLDWGIVAFAVVLAFWGYRQGLIVGAATLAGFALGALIGGRLAPQLLDGGSSSPYAPLFAAVGAVLLGSVLGLGFEGAAHDLRVRMIRGQALHVLDGALGAILVGAVALGIAWVFGAVALHAPGATELRRDVQRSLILRSLNETLPPSGAILNALNRVDPAPEVTGPRTPVSAPDPAIAGDPDVARAGDSVVRVLGTACGLAIEGSGWAVAPGLIVTNAHVVAGEEDTSVTTKGGSMASATVVYFDRRNDLALLEASLPLPVLPQEKAPTRGTSAAVLGYPENGPYSVAPARFGETTEVLSEDAYGKGSVRRSISSFRGEVRSGNSGGPLVDANGRVLGTVFASTQGGPPSGFAIPSAPVLAALEGSAGPVGTGACTG